MRWIVVLSAIALVLCVGSACFGGDKQQGPKIDVTGLTGEDVTQRAFDALDRPGLVFHAKLTLTVKGHDKVVHSETWIDPERQVARHDIEGSAPPAVPPVTDGCNVSQTESRAGGVGQLRSDSRSRFLASNLDYLAAMESTEPDSRQVEAVFLKGAPSIRVRMSGKRTGFLAGEYRTDVVLDGSFLPLRVEYSQQVIANVVQDYASDFVSRDTLPADFFPVNFFPQCKLSE